MLRQLPSYLCSQCRSLIFHSGAERWAKNRTSGALAVVQTRNRSNAHAKKSSRNSAFRAVRDTGHREGSRASIAGLPDDFRPRHQLKVAPQDAIRFFESDVYRWSVRAPLQARFQAFGIHKKDVRPLVDLFVFAVQQHELSDAEGFEKYALKRFSQPFSDMYHSEIDAIYSSILFVWAGDPGNMSRLLQVVSMSTVQQVQRLAAVTDLRYPHENYPFARTMNRKIIMHVGPTNSGKTHHALRALAAATAGVYASPLRLLAYEIWERLNLGQIVPRGTDLTLAEVLAASKGYNPQFACKCSMVTGEEQKIVEDARLLSCTVEMLPLFVPYDVGVIDEIQMLGDSERGSSWTRALLGLPAKELHLCGEESAVPLVKEMLKDTGEEVIVNRYERLTPLVVEERSLGGDFKNVRPGDCIVTFNRSSIFEVKALVEQETGMRCAVVYGKLPPEIRSEQATLFNDPNSGYDVLVGSDAIGMGLNLKIRRVIFEAVAKWDGRTRFLSPSQVKQIAGRAGRYGMHDEKCGWVTTLHEADLPFLRQMIQSPMQPLSYARIRPAEEEIGNIAQVLPANASWSTTLDAYMHAARLQPVYRPGFTNAWANDVIAEFMDKQGKDLTLSERTDVFHAPIPWRENKSMAIVTKYMQMYKTSLNVDLMKPFEGSQYKKVLERIEAYREGDEEPKITGAMMADLEIFHRLVVFYVWMSFRSPVAYNQFELASKLKHRIEVALEWALETMSKARLSASKEKVEKKIKAVVYHQRLPGARPKRVYPTNAETTKTPAEAHPA